MIDRLCHLLIDAPSLHAAICHASKLNPKTIDDSRWRNYSHAELLGDDDEDTIYTEEPDLLRVKVQGATENASIDDEAARVGGRNPAK